MKAIFIALDGSTETRDIQHVEAEFRVPVQVRRPLMYEPDLDMSLNPSLGYMVPRVYRLQNRPSDRSVAVYKEVDKASETSGAPFVVEVDAFLARHPEITRPIQERMANLGRINARYKNEPASAYLERLYDELRAVSYEYEYRNEPLLTSTNQLPPYMFPLPSIDQSQPLPKAKKVDKIEIPVEPKRKRFIDLKKGRTKT